MGAPVAGGRASTRSITPGRIRPMRLWRRPTGTGGGGAPSLCRQGHPQGRGGRKGVDVLEDESGPKGAELHSRLREHSETVNGVGDPFGGGFPVPVPIVDEIWIPLGENLLISRFMPVWNTSVERVRKPQTPARAGLCGAPAGRWDVLHPGRGLGAEMSGAAGDASDHPVRSSGLSSGPGVPGSDAAVPGVVRVVRHRAAMPRVPATRTPPAAKSLGSRPIRCHFRGRIPRGGIPDA